jgi:peptidyl-prolyl cis-trans isomerase SurA
MTAIARMLMAGSLGLVVAAASFAPHAHAQAVVAAVNDDPITNIDIDQHMKMLRVLRKPATKEAAMEDVIATRLKLMETSKYKLSAGNQDIGQALSIAGRPLKMDAQQLATTLHNAGISDDQWQQKFKAEAAWMMYIRALNRSLEVSENVVRDELAKEHKTRGTEYTIRQVIMVVPASAGVAGLQAKMAQAQSLRSRFTDCDTGVELARGMTDTAVRDPMRRTESALTPEMIKLLDQTPVGHLTPPSRGASGIEMVAVCNKVERRDTAAEDNVRNELLSKKLEGASDQKYRELRAKAIVVRK